MESVLIEYSRFDNLDTGLLQKDKPYLKVVGTRPVGIGNSPFNHAGLLNKLSKLRYSNGISSTELEKILQTLSNDIKGFFIDPAKEKRDSVQFDLVFNAAELGLIPFECILDENGLPYFACAENELVLTRRIRQNHFPASRDAWPLVPRMLFAYADTVNLPEVPSTQHLTLLRSALRLWLPEDMEFMNQTLTVLKQPTLQRLNGELEEGIKIGRPYTHVHVLAHGVEMEGAPTSEDDDTTYGKEFGVGLFKPASVKDFATLFESLSSKPIVVSYMVCDSGNAANALTKDKNIVQVTHRAGVPIVIGSQLPLTIEGSIQITKDFYGGVLNGDDVRRVLHRTRCALYKNKNTGHDWLSFISYVRLPEGYESYLEESIPVREMHALKIIREETEKLIQNKSASAGDYQEMFDRLLERLKILLINNETLLGKKLKAGLLEENSGLIGSCYKRLAELVFFRDRALSIKAEESFNEQVKYLEKARAWYHKAALHNLSHHWSVVQFLCMNHIINDGKENIHYRYAAELSCHHIIESCEAEKQNVLKEEASEGEKELKIRVLDEKIVWAYGSLIEYSLLFPDDRSAKELDGKSICETLKEKSDSLKSTFYINSVKLQLNRYVNWWTRENHFRLVAPDLASRATILMDCLK